MQQPPNFLHDPQVVTSAASEGAAFVLDVTVNIFSLFCREHRRCMKCDLARSNFLKNDEIVRSTVETLGCSQSRRKITRKLEAAAAKAIVFHKSLDGAEYHGPLPGQ
jgi:hypothetical protein